METLRHEEESYEPGQYVRHTNARPGDGRDPVVEIVEDLGTIEVPCGETGCRSNCLEYVVRSAPNRPRKSKGQGEGYHLAECKLDPLVDIL